MRRRVFVSVFLVSMGIARADEEAAATNLFNAGRDAMQAGDYAAACPKLQESVRLKPTVGALAKLSACEEHEKRLASAYARWQQALNLARSQGDPRATEVEAELARIDKLVPKLLITSDGAATAGLVLQVDDLVIHAEGLGVPLAVEPGSHRIRASAPSHRTWSTTVETRADGTTVPVTVPILEASIEQAPAPVVVPPPISTPTPTPARPSSWPAMRVAAVVTVGAGTVGIVLGSAFGITAIGQRDGAHCQGTVCPETSNKEMLDGAKRSADASTVFFVAGGVLVAGGVTMWLLSRSSRAVTVSFTAGGAVLHGTW